MDELVNQNQNNMDNSIHSKRIGVIGVGVNVSIVERMMIDETVRHIKGSDGIILIANDDIDIKYHTLEKLKLQFGEDVSVHLITPEDILSQTQNPFEHEPIPFKIQPLVDNFIYIPPVSINRVEKQQKKYAERYYSKNLRKK